MRWAAFFIFPQAILLIIGLAAAEGLREAFKGDRMKARFLIPLSYLLGESIVSVTLFLSSLLLGRFVWGIFWALGSASFIFLIWRALRPKGEVKPFSQGHKRIVAWSGILPVLLILLICLPNIKISFYDVLSQWDPRSLWFFHGKAFFLDNRVDPTYLANPSYAFSHPDYPPFISLLAVFHSHFLGTWHEILNKSYIFFHWAASLILLYFLWVRLSITPLFAFLGVAFIQFVYAPYAVWGLGDSLWSLSLLLGMSFMFPGFEERRPPGGRLEIVLGVVFLAMASNIKQEGLSGAVLFLAIFSAWALWQKRARPAFLGWLILFFVAAAAYWPAFVWANHFSIGRTIDPLGFLRYDLPTLVFRAATIFRLPFQEKLLIPRVFYFVAGALAFSQLFLLARIKKWREYMLPWIVLLTFWAILFIDFLIYLGSPRPLEWLLRTSLERVLVVNVLLSLFALILLSRLPAGLGRGDADASFPAGGGGEPGDLQDPVRQ